jgi:protein arginine kinase activator
MAEEIRCLKCNKRTATVKMIRIIGGKTHSIRLCEQCAAEISPYQQQALSLHEAIEKVLAKLVQEQNEEERTEPGTKTDGPLCPRCGTSEAVYRKSFLLGCPQCYSTFEDIIESQLRRLHGSTRHVGRAPTMGRNLGAQAETALVALQKDLALAVLGQDFEKAVQLRDRIRQLQGGSNHVGTEM